MENVKCWLLGVAVLCAVCVQAQVSSIISTDESVVVTTSYVSPNENLNAVNDGLTASNSATKPAGGVYANYTTPNTYQWVQYEFAEANFVSEAAVYWYANNTTVRLPNVAYVEYFDLKTDEWVRQGNIGKAANTFNALYIPRVLTTKIRVYMYHATASTGISEFRIKGYKPAATQLDGYYSAYGDEAMQAGRDYITAGANDRVSFAVSIAPDDTLNIGTWTWTGPNGFTATDSVLTLTDLTPEHGGIYTATFTNALFGASRHSFTLVMYDGEVGAPYAWKPYSPSLNYDFRAEYGDIQEPTRDMEEFNVAGRVSRGWWTYAWGPRARSLGTDKVGLAGIENMLSRMNKDFKYFRETMGWPPDLRARDGYRSTIYLYGSGLPTDGEDSTALGGWQSATRYNGKNYPMVLISYYPVYSFHPRSTYTDKAYQTGAVVHEGIHALLADLPGAKNSAWFHEAGNTWLQQEYEARMTNNYSSMGFLNAPALIAPFMPIECYSGWLQDGSFGGPAAEGVNMFNNGQQVCTWRNLLGGTQYGNMFAVYLGQTLGDAIVPWIWRNCPSRVLEGMADSLGSVQMRRLITEYRAKQAMLDFGKWTNASKALLNNNFNGRCEQEWSPYWIKVDPWNMTPYVKTRMLNDSIIPEARTLPGWSGANQIPIHIGKTATQVVLDFVPLGRNMTMQLCYRTKSGQIVYSTPVSQGECALNIPLATADRPANNVVIAVVSNTDYIYEGDATRKAKFDYRIVLRKGAYHSGSPLIKWYEYTQTFRDNSFTDIEDTYSTPELQITLLSNIARAGEELQVNFNCEPEQPVGLKLVGINGVTSAAWTLASSGSITLPANISRGIYLLQIDLATSREVIKVIVE